MTDSTEQLIINFSSSTKDSAEKFIEFLKLRIVNRKSWQNINEVSFLDNKGTYYTASLALTVHVSDVGKYLVDIDAIKDGLVSGIDELLSFIFNDITAKIAYQCGQAALVEVNKYLHNKTQEQQTRIDSSDAYFVDLVKTLAKQKSYIERLEERLNSQIAYVHTYINLTKLSGLVREIADKVDPDLLDNYEIVKVH